MGAFEQFGDLLAKNKSLTASTENSAFGIVILISASHEHAGVSSALFESWRTDFQPWFQRRLRCLLPITKMLDLASVSVELVRDFVEVDDRATFNPFACEFFAQSIMRRLGILTAPTRIATVEHAKKLPPSDVVKVAAPGGFRLRWSPTEGLGFGNAFEYCLVSSALPNAVSLDFAFRKWLRGSRSAMESGLRDFSSMVIGKHSLFFQQVADVVAKGCVEADYLYAETHPTEKEIGLMEQAGKWDGRQYLKISAARVFLGCSMAHLGNVLITTDAQLASIDHENIGIETGEDLEMLFRFMNRNSVAFRMLNEIANLTEEDIHAAIAEIPAHRACGSNTDLEGYFIERLRLFKSLCHGATVAPVSMAACLP